MSYSLRQQNTWQKKKSNGKKAGKKELRGIQSVKVKIASNVAGGVEYQTCSNGTWSKNKKNGKSTLKNDSIEAVKIKLYGAVKKKFDIYYRVRVETNEWLGWAKNGKAAGTAHYNRDIVGIQIKLVEKNGKVDALEEPAFLNWKQMVVKINRSHDYVVVYQNKVPIKAFLCSTGTATPVGTFSAGVKYRWRALFHHCYGQYVTQITGNILFHSVPYNSTNVNTLQTEEYNKLGTPASLGCIRMRVCDTKWIYENCPSGTQIVIFDGPKDPVMAKPKLTKIPTTQNYDPTDLAVK